MGYTFDTNLFSDFFKDTYGFRPRNNRFYDVDTTDDERQEMWDDILESHAIEMRCEEDRQNRASADFESLIITTIGYGAGNRETAIRWIMDGLDDHYDASYLCYTLGIPYTYENEISQSFG